MRKQHRKKKVNLKDVDPFKGPVIFGDIITLDNVSVSDEHRSRHNDKTMCVLLDRYSGWIGAYPSPARSTPAIVNTLNDFIGRKDYCDLLYFDGAPSTLQQPGNCRYVTTLAMPTGLRKMVSQSEQSALSWKARVLCCSPAVSNTAIGQKRRSASHFFATLRSRKATPKRQLGNFVTVLSSPVKESLSAPSSHICQRRSA